jgi:hypothetical protein
MRLVKALSATIVVLVSQSTLLAQSSQPSQASPSTSVPRLIKITGVFRPADGLPAVAVETVTLSIYADPEGGTPLWRETQTIPIDAQGRYALLLGATRPDGIPAEVFGGEGAQWLGTAFERAGEVEGPRTRLTSVPYAIRAADADTLGGRPASEYLRAPGAGDTKDRQANAATAETGPASNDVVLAGTPNFLAKYVTTADVGNSGVFEAADGSIGLGTGATQPFDRLHIRYNNNTGDFTGIAVQNTSGGGLAYSGMLFYDHTNALTQFQGYNNITHEYRINNIARVSPGGAFNGSINFMLGGSSRFLVHPTLGIAMNAPVAISAGAADTGLFVNSSGTIGVSVENTNPAGTAIYGLGQPLDAVGVFGDTDDGIGVLGFALHPATGWAGYFDGDVNVTGVLFKGAGAFRIDHPLDPEHKYLNHSFVESPDMKNIYDGVAVLDESGEATVTLPDWFEALNQDFRYQLTPMGAPFVPYIAQEIADNQFTIAGGIPGKKVSWQVTGVRHDAFANANRIQVEEIKPDAAVGTYLHPQAFGQSTNTVLATPSAQDQKPQPTDAVKARLRAISQKPEKK